jgi:hypothetical protein
MVRYLACPRIEPSSLAITVNAFEKYPSANQEDMAPSSETLLASPLTQTSITLHLQLHVPLP